jgi:hypothetical protein
MRLLLLALVVALVLPATARAQVDMTPPVITPEIFGSVGSADWYTSGVTVNWKVAEDPGSPVLSASPGCQPATFSADTPGFTQTCTATSAGGTATVTTKPIRIDQTPPTVTAAKTSRPADHAGWFTSPVSVAWSGSDATSGISSCTSASYAGPDSAGAALSGTCRDAAGNTSAPLTISLAFDATAPSLSGVTATPGDTTASLAWKPSADTQSVSVVAAASAPGVPQRAVYQGPGTTFRDTGLTNGVAYTYTVTAFDAAGNAASQAVSVTPFSMLVAPLPNARIPGTRARKNPPMLTWQPRTGATYYNVQIFRRMNGRWRKIMSKWPDKNHLQLPSSWRYRGRTWQLVPAHYRWYVWPGYGDKRRQHYGKLLGKRDFYVTDTG